LPISPLRDGQQINRQAIVYDESGGSVMILVRGLAEQAEDFGG
jgi:hypothetical protein